MFAIVAEIKERTTPEEINELIEERKRPEVEYTPEAEWTPSLGPGPKKSQSSRVGRREVL